MSSLIGSSRTVDNATMRARTEAAIRQIASERRGWEGAAGKLAKAALVDPGFVVSAFLVRIGVNGEVAAAACPDCGYSTAPDADLLYIVGATWGEVADSEYPELAAAPGSGDAPPA